MSGEQAEVIGVAGAGVIGAGVAQLFAQAGRRVILVDNQARQLELARGSIASHTKLYRLLNGQRSEVPEVLARVTFTGEVGALREAGFVIENITEDWGQKRLLHEELGAIVGEEVIVAANTSAIPITRIASVYRAPRRVLGMHFMNPPPLMPVVELIRAYHTSGETVAAAQALLASVGRQSIVVNDSPGFVTNRVMMLMVNEAMFLVHEGVSSVHDVDRLFKTCFGHRMGPLETADLIGLDTVLRSIEVLYEEFSDSKYRPCPLLKKMVQAGVLGCKSGKGFYDYTGQVG